MKTVGDGWAGVQAAGSGAPEARIRDHARYMHGRDTNMRQCDMVLAVGALGRIRTEDGWLGLAACDVQPFRHSGNYPSDILHLFKNVICATGNNQLN